MDSVKIMDTTDIRRVGFHEAKEDIDWIYQSNKTLSPYQSFKFLSVTRKGFVNKKPLSTIFIKEVTWVQYRDNKPVVVLPLLIDTKCKKGYLRGEFTSAGILDAIYVEDWTYEEFLALISYVEKEVSFLSFTRVPEESLLLLFSKRYWFIEDTLKKSTCVSIPIQNTYEDWYASLSKNVRQNLRTSINRLQKDGHTFSVKHHWKEKMSSERYKRIQWLYCQRLAEHNLDNQMLIRFLHPILFVLKYYNPMSLSFRKLDDVFYNELFIDNDLAAVCCGFVRQNNELIVPRFFFNSKFSRYSPGGILISEIVRWLSTPGISGGGYEAGFVKRRRKI